MGDRQAKSLLETCCLKIGWVYIRARKRIEVPRCYRCHDYGQIVPIKADFATNVTVLNIKLESVTDHTLRRDSLKIK